MLEPYDGKLSRTVLRGEGDREVSDLPDDLASVQARRDERNEMVDRRRDLLRFRVDLVGILPPIWREILVPGGYSFWDLHVAIQDSMGWWDCHLHEFRVPDPVRRNDLLIGIPTGEQPEGSPDVLPGWEISVVDYLSEPGKRAEYEYDFGDSWIHELTLSGIERREKGRRYPQCVAGERACPPEDCGGVPGYEALVEALLDPEHSEFETLGEWISKGWGPELFRPDKVRFDNPTRRWERAFLRQS